MTISASRRGHKPAAVPLLSVKSCQLVIGVLLVLSAVVIGVDPNHAPVFLLGALASIALPWRTAWIGARGTALRPALVWLAIALVLSLGAQIAALAEPISTGRPLAGRLTYLFVLAILAALITVLNARTPGERVWAGLMFLLVVVFMIPWLEEAGQMRRPQGATLVRLDSPWTLFYGLLVLVGVTNYLPTRFGLAAAGLGVGFILEYLGLTRSDWSLAQRAAIWEWVAWTFTVSAWIARWSASRTPRAAGLNAIWFWFRDHWGVVWALRNQDRFNRTAELGGWPVKLTWFGLEAVDRIDCDREPPTPAEAEPAFRRLLRRFAQAERLDQVTAPAGAARRAPASER